MWPAGMAYMVAGQITGSDNAEEESQSEYLRSSEKSNLLSYYIGERFSGYHEDAYLVGIGPTGGVLSEESLKDQTLDGTVLYAAKIPV